MHIYRSLNETTSKRVSFVLNTKNRAEYLDMVLANCRRIVKPEDELIVIDGGSTDHTAKVVENYSDIISIFLSEADTGPVHACNKGILLSRGRYIRQLADDDIIYPEAFEQAIAVMERHPEIDLLLCGGTKQRGKKTWAVYFPEGINYGKSTEDVFRYLGPASGTGHVIRKNAIARVGLLAPRVNADAAFVLECIRRGGSVKFCRINLYHHIIYPHSVGVKGVQAHLADTMRLAWEYCSPQFFLWVYITQILHQQLRGSRFRIVRFLGRWLKLRVLRKRYAADDCVWDGGFS